MEEPEVSRESIGQILNILENREQVKKKPVMHEDQSIQTRKELYLSLKQGRIPGTAILEWSDAEGTLQASALDFLIASKVKAVDPESGQSVTVESKTLVDGSWRVKY